MYAVSVHFCYRIGQPVVKAIVLHIDCSIVPWIEFNDIIFSLLASSDETNTKHMQNLRCILLQYDISYLIQGSNSILSLIILYFQGIRTSI